MTDVARHGPFKRCPFCGREWETREDFLSDCHNRLNGYQCNSGRIRSGERVDGMLVFTHYDEHCGTTLAVPAARFRDGEYEGEGNGDDH
jgi:predicted amidophosphoribosyltransferase